MKCEKRWSWTARAVPAAAIAAVLLGYTFASATPPPGKGGGRGVTNPAYVVMDAVSVSFLKLLSYDGLQEQTIVRAKAHYGMRAPTCSPDGNWIAFLKKEDSDISAPYSLRIIRADGSGERVIFLFTSGVPEAINGMQWVPGEIDRIVYSTMATKDIYVISTLDENPVPRLILPGVTWLSGASLSPDLDPQTSGYQGAIAFVLDEAWQEYRPVLTVAFAADGEFGLEVDVSSMVQATTLSDGVATPSWSHDGLEIAFLYHTYSYPHYGNSLEVLPVLVDSNGITLLEDAVQTIYDSALVDLYGPYHAVVHRPCWSPDDSLIGFCARVGIEPDGGKPYDLFRARSDGTGAVNVTNGSMRPVYADWNPTWTFDLQ